MNSRFVWLLGLVAGVMALGQPAAAAEEGARPSIAAGVPFFYYNDLDVAKNWYEHKLGLKKTTDKGWVVIFELTPSSFIGLVNATGGTLSPTEDKGVLLSIETEELEAWYERLKSVGGIDLIHPIQNGGGGLVQEFQMRDPEGYIIEFFRWKTAPDGK